MLKKSFCVGLAKLKFFSGLEQRLRDTFMTEDKTCTLQAHSRFPTQLDFGRNAEFKNLA